eukprot:SAG11_NODE_23759_length_383_cov_1.401408_1_plen_24_part_01
MLSVGLLEEVSNIQHQDGKEFVVE